MPNSRNSVGTGITGPVRKSRCGRAKASEGSREFIAAKALGTGCEAAAEAATTIRILSETDSGISIAPG